MELLLLKQGGVEDLYGRPVRIRPCAAEGRAKAVSTRERRSQGCLR